MMYTVTSGNLNGYQGACDLIKELKKEGLSANITIGGIHIHVETKDEIDKMFEVCSKVNAQPYIGETVSVEWFNVEYEERLNELRKYT